MKDLRQQVIRQFGLPAAQAFYVARAEAGLWPSEEIIIKRYFPRGANVLDLGCGTGRTTIPLFQMGYTVIGVDITPEMVANAKRIVEAKGLAIPYEAGDATALRFPDASFDCVLFSNNGWTQIPGRAERIQALQEIRRVLKPNGYFIFTAHVRRWNGFTLFWLAQFIKQFLLKPLGFRVDEEEWGDRFFSKETSAHDDLPHYEKQYIHIPSVAETKHAITRAGFALEYYEQSHIIAHEHGPHSPMFYVCRK